MSPEAARAALSSAWGPLVKRCGVRGGAVDVVMAEPAGSRGWRSFATVGLVATAVGAELVTYGRPEAEWPGDVLRQLAEYALAEPLGAYDAVALDGPAGGDGTLTGVVLLPPYFEHSAVEPFAAAGCGLWWAAPLTTAEFELAILAGGRAIEDVLFEADLRPDPDPARPSVL